MNKDSILLKITIFFVFIILSINSFLYYYASSLHNTLNLHLGINILLISFYIYIYVNIMPLQKQGTLFMRNIMHELKTPITKAKLVTDTLEDNKRKEILQKAFYRIEYLLGEFSRIEELTSGKIQLNKKDFIIEELVNQAIDILLLDNKKLNITMNKKQVNVDFKLFSVALKNLIDNAVKHSIHGTPELLVTNTSITIINKGKKLEKNINEYFKPFNRDYESIEQGLGLGLYITNSIVKIHGFKLKHKYTNESHFFSIEFQ